MEEKLFQWHPGLKGSETGEWNGSPESLYAEAMTRIDVRRAFVPNGGRASGMGSSRSARMRRPPGGPSARTDESD
jgi:hypothetical protein